MLNKNEVYEATIVDYTSEGQGIAKIDGCAVFIPNAIAGEVCRVRIEKAQKTWATGKIVEILEKCNLKPEEVLMVGNDTKEDFASTLVGIPMILVTDTVKGDADSIECLFKGTLAEVKTYLDTIL